LQLKISTRCEGVKDGIYDEAVVFEAGEQSAAVNEIKFLGEDPFIFGVINFESAIGWDTVIVSQTT
jgi:hypothetical protein